MHQKKKIQKYKCHTVSSSCVKALPMIVGKEIEVIIHRKLWFKQKEAFITNTVCSFQVEPSVTVWLLNH